MQIYWAEHNLLLLPLKLTPMQTKSYVCASCWVHTWDGGASFEQILVEPFLQHSKSGSCMFSLNPTDEGF